MTVNGWLQIAFFLLAILAVTKPLGRFMTRVFAREKTWLDPVLRPIERLIYKSTGVDETREMRWTEYAVAMLLFSAVSMIVLYAMQRMQQWLPWNPQGFGAVAPDLAFNTAASFTTNTNWQAYSGESTMSYFTQMAGLAYHNFVSAAVGIAIAIAFIRGIAQKEKETLGNFWVDLVRCLLWVLLPICIVGALVLVSQGVVQNLRPYDKAAVIDPQSVTAPDAVGQAADDRRQGADDRAGPGGVAGDHQAVRNQRRRLHEREQRAPVREPDAAVQLPRDVRHLRHFGRPHVHARRHDRLAQARLGGVGGDGVPIRRRRDDGVLGRGAREPAAHGGRRRSDDDGDVLGRKHGRQGSALRHRQHRAVRDGDDGRELRRDQRLARLVHANRRPRAARQHPAQRGRVRRCGRRACTACWSTSSCRSSSPASWSAARRSTWARRSRPSRCRWRCSPS